MAERRMVPGDVPASGKRPSCGLRLGPAVLAALLPGCGTPLRADAILTDAGSVVGSVVGISADSVTLRATCGGTDAGIPWATIRHVSLSAGCDAPVPELARPAAHCAALRHQYAIHFRNGAVLEADGVVLSPDGTFNFEFGMRMGHGPRGDVATIVPHEACPTEVEDGLPTTFCIEPKRFAVNFSYAKPLPNRVLTRGFSFYLETVPKVAPETFETMRETIRQGFNTALTIWTSELWRTRAHRDPRLVELLDGMASKSPSGMVLFTPPQVVALDCPQTATFVVRAFVKESGPFSRPPANELVVAYAANPGRTILLNYFDYACWRNAYFKYVLDAATHCVNATPILTHEIGHAFGLGHSDEVRSIMNAEILVTTPSPADLDALAAKLMQPIEGTAAGDIQPFSENGARVE